MHHYRLSSPSNQQAVSGIQLIWIYPQQLPDCGTAGVITAISSNMAGKAHLLVYMVSGNSPVELSNVGSIDSTQQLNAQVLQQDYHTTLSALCWNFHPC